MLLLCTVKVKYRAQHVSRNGIIGRHHTAHYTGIRICITALHQSCLDRLLV